MGSRAATILMDRIEGRLGDDWSLRARVTPKLVLRESTSLPAPVLSTSARPVTEIYLTTVVEQCSIRRCLFLKV